MALIDPKGLLYGERLGDCSDEAQLHWPRLFATCNGYGRTELSYDRLCDTVYSSFKTKPTYAQLSTWFQDYQKNFLLFIYEAADGSLWGQWITSEKFLPKYKTSVDRQSPTPDPVALKTYTDQYIQSRKSKYLSFQSFHKSSKILENIQKSSEDFRRVVVVGVGVEVNTNTPLRTRELEPPEPPVHLERVESDSGTDNPPADLPPIAYSRGMLETLCIPLVPATMQAGAAAICAYARERGLEPHLATAELTRAARDALDRHEAVDKWWFTDRKWAKTQIKNGGERGSKNERIRLKALEELDRRQAYGDGGSTAGCTP